MGVSMAACERIFAWLKLSDEVGQLRVWSGGFAAWLRFEHHHLNLVKDLDFDAVAALPRLELTTGPVIYIGEVFAVRPGVRAFLHSLKHLPGVTHWAGHRDKGTRWKVQALQGVNDVSRSRTAA